MADRIEQEINKVTRSIDTLTSKIQNLKKELESGNYGTDQISRMQAQLEELNATLSKKATQHDVLINKQEIQQSSREFEGLQKAVETLRVKLMQLKELRNGLELHGLTGTNDFAQVEKDITKAERALSSFQGRIQKNFTALGQRKTTADIEAEGRTQSYAIDKRIKDAGPTGTLTRVPTSGVGGGLVTARESIDLEGRLGVSANTPRTLEQVNQELKQTLALLRQLKEQSIASRGGVAGDQELNNQRKLNELLKERASLRQGTSATGGGPAPYKIDESKLSPEQLAYLKQFEASVNGAGNAAKSAAAGEEELTAAQKRAKKAAEDAALEEKRLADARTKVATDPRYREALQQAQARGFSLDNLTAIEDRGGNVQRLKFAQTVGGVNQSFNPYVNMLSGKSTPGLSSQFRTFGSDIARDIGQFTKWSIAIAAVYTPMQKLGELMTIMVDNESRLADATIAANVPFEKSGEIFNEVSVAADQAGESINTTIDAYTQAIRAAGRYGTEQEKTAQATALLNDALILSKLSALDQSNSIDTLSAALLQSDRQLNQGQELLNKWVRVSQIANVGIDALATGVAVLGDAAETSGLSVDQLNGLIAVLSEQSISGSKEAANTAKALVGAYQSDKAEAALNKYGIALRKTNGEVRGFLEIYQELATLRQQGVLSEAGVSELALALGGGGVRRAKDASALINSTDRLNKLAQESANVTGKDSIANDALAKKLETVQTANTRLANSFQQLAETLGDDGGLLDGMKSLINLLTTGVKATNELFSILGRSGPILATVVAGLGAMNAYYGVGGRKDVALQSLGATGQFKGFGFGLGGGVGGAQFGGPLVNGGGPLADILRMNYRGAGIIGGAGVALQGFSNIAAGRNENAIGNVVGGVIGGAIGAALGGPIGLAAGANIGSAAGDAMVTSLKTHKGDFESLFTPPTSRGGNFDTVKAFFSGTASGYSGLPKTLQGLSDDEIKKLLFTAVGGGNESAGTLRARNFQYFSNQQYTEGAAALTLLKKENPVLAAIFEQEKVRREAEATAANKIKTQAQSQQFTNLQDQAAQARQYQLGRLSKGEITTAEYGRISNQLGGFPSVSIKSVEALKGDFTGISKEITNAKDAYDAFLYIAQYGTQEQITQLSSYSDDIVKLNEYLDKMKQGENVIGTTLELSFGDQKITSEKQLQDLIAQQQTALKTGLGATVSIVQQQQAQTVKLPQLVGDYTKPLAGQDQDTIVRQGLAIQEKYLIQTGKTADEIERFKAGIEAFYTTVDRGTGAQFEAVNGLTQQFYDLSKAAAEAAGQLKEVNPIGFQKFDVPFNQLQMLAQQSLMIGSSWQKKWNYDYKPEDQIAIANDGVVQPLHADFKILALLLEKIVDQNQKQLDGQYNIPEGATFWVPLTAAYYRRQNEGGAGDLQSMLDSLAVDGNTNATNNNTRALEQLSSVMTNTDRLKLEYQDTKLKPGESKPLAGFQNEQRLRAEYQLNEYHTPGGLGNPMPRTQEQQGGVSPTFMQTLESGLRQALMNLVLNFKPYGQGIGAGSLSTGEPSGQGSVGGRSMTNNAPVVPPTRLDLKFSSNINLMVDGRILAQTLQSYMASELLRTEQTQGVITKRYVI